MVPSNPIYPVLPINPALLQDLSSILNSYQDICDALDDPKTTPEQKLEQITPAIHKIGMTCRDLLPG